MSQSSARTRVVRPAQVRELNSAVVLQLLRRHQRLSRAEISRFSGLSEGTVSRIIAELLERRLVVEDGAENSTGGRPATRLQLSPDVLAVGVDIQNWEMRFCLGSLRGRMIETAIVRTPADPEAMMEVIAERFADFAGRYGVSGIEGLGISTRGIVDSRNGVITSGNLPRWVEVPVRKQLQERCGIPVYVENNVRAAALAEYEHSASQTEGKQCVLFVLCDEGLGVGIIMDGRLYHGPRMSAGEFGQMVIADQGGPETHDRPGCFEELVCNPAIWERYAKLTTGRSGVQSGDSAARVRRICHRAIDGEPEAIETLKVTARYLGIGLSNLIWGLDPDVIVLSATLNAAWQLMLPVITAQFAHWPAFQRVILRPSELGDQAALIGATGLPFARIFQTADGHRITGEAPAPA
ncbi:MAG: ROK family transcriptional regulator [Bryobacterales bacterium]|nr:ROK family transcriptional regulator [Bryobacterales bacterium]